MSNVVLCGIDSATSSFSIPRPSRILMNKSLSLSEEEGSDNNDSDHVANQQHQQENHGEIIPSLSTGTPSTPSWNVSDNKVRTYPPFYPRPDPTATCRIDEETTTPSIIAVRISEFLKRRNRVSVEYDDESAIAHVMTIDRCRFDINLWRILKSSSSNSKSTNSSSSIMVECVRIDGPIMAYRWTVKAIMQAVRCLDEESNRSDANHSSQRFSITTQPRQRKGNLLQNDATMTSDVGMGEAHQENKSSASSSSDTTTKVVQALENVILLLRKDRIDAQMLGMEMLVNLTNVDCVGMDSAIMASLAIVGAQIPSISSTATTSSSSSVMVLNEIHREFVQRLIMKRKLRGSGYNHYNRCLRSYALRALTNALTLLSEEQPETLREALLNQVPKWTSSEVVDVLVEDTQGDAFSLGGSSSLTSQHESAFARRCVEILGAHDEHAKTRMIQ